MSTTVVNIIKAVRYCIDEETVNASNIDDASAYTFDNTTTDTGLMDNIIKSKIGDALRWVCLYASVELLEDTTESIVVDAELYDGHTTDHEVTLSLATDCYKLTMPSGFIKLSRVRVAGWHKAVTKLISEDSEEYLQLYDINGAEATNERPVAVLINKSKKEIELWPSDAESPNVEVTFVKMPTINDNATEIDLPSGVMTSFIYYIAYLLLTAYADARAEQMLKIATMNLGNKEP